VLTSWNPDIDNAFSKKQTVSPPNTLHTQKELFLLYDTCSHLFSFSLLLHHSLLFEADQLQLDVTVSLSVIVAEGVDLCPGNADEIGHSILCGR
jgi:hypothetical protein